MLSHHFCGAAYVDCTGKQGHSLSPDLAHVDWCPLSQITLQPWIGHPQPAGSCDGRFKVVVKGDYKQRGNVQVTVSEPLAEAPSSSGTIVLVVAEGLEVLLPMAGVSSAAAHLDLNKGFPRLLGCPLKHPLFSVT